VKPYNKGIAAQLTAMLELLDDNHLVFTNLFGVGPIDIVTVNLNSGEVCFYDAKCDRESRHKKRQLSEIQKKLGVKNFYVNLRKRTKRLDGKVEKLFIR